MAWAGWAWLAREYPAIGRVPRRGRGTVKCGVFAPEILLEMTDEPAAADPVAARNTGDVARAAPAYTTTPSPAAIAAARAEGTAEPRRPPLTLRNYLWLIGAAIVILLALHWLGPVLTPFLVGAILAYLGTPLVDRAAQRRVPRALATLIVVLLFGLVLFALFLVLVPLIQAEVSLAAQRLPDLVTQVLSQVTPWAEERLGVRLAFDFDTVRAFIAENAQAAQDLSLKVLASVRTGGRILIALLLNLALIPVVMFYLLRDWHALFARLEDLVPRRWQPKTREVAQQIDSVLAEFLRGQLMVMVVLAVYYSIALSVVGLDRAVAIGVLTGLLIFIPYVGFGMGLVLGIAAALLQWHGWPPFLAVVAVYVVGQLLENYVLVPYLVGERIGLHPLAVIFALLAFGQLFGFAGVLLALPISAALLVGLRHVRAAYLDSPVYRQG
jgi:predicted PurR-regulated permease PerM